jgi:hypothetical protein
MKGFLRSPRLFGSGSTFRATDPPSLLVAGSQKTGSPAPHAGEPILFKTFWINAKAPDWMDKAP